MKQWQASKRVFAYLLPKLQEITFVFKTTVHCNNRRDHSHCLTNIFIGSRNWVLCCGRKALNEISTAINSTTIQEASEKLPLRWDRRKKSRVDKKKKTKYIVKLHNVWLLTAGSHYSLGPILKWFYVSIFSRKTNVIQAYRSTYLSSSRAWFLILSNERKADIAQPRCHTGS